jgi:hypothetical protein
MLPLYRERLSVVEGAFPAVAWPASARSATNRPTPLNPPCLLAELTTKLAHLQQVLGHPADLVPKYLPPPAITGGDSHRHGAGFASSAGPPRYGPSGIGLGLPRSLSADKVASVAEAGEGRAFNDVTEKRITELQNLIQRGEEDCVRALAPGVARPLDRARTDKTSLACVLRCRRPTCSTSASSSNSRTTLSTSSSCRSRFPFHSRPLCPHRLQRRHQRNPSRPRPSGRRPTSRPSLIGTATSSSATTSHGRSSGPRRR